jgi:hypothetical protein
VVCRIRDTDVGLAPVSRATCRTPDPAARASWICRICSAGIGGRPMRRPWLLAYTAARVDRNRGQAPDRVKPLR